MPANDKQISYSGCDLEPHPTKREESPSKCCLGCSDTAADKANTAADIIDIIHSTKELAPIDTCRQTVNKRDADSCGLECEDGGGCCGSGQSSRALVPQRPSEGSTASCSSGCCVPSALPDLHVSSHKAANIVVLMDTCCPVVNRGDANFGGPKDQECHDCGNEQSSCAQVTQQPRDGCAASCCVKKDLLKFEPAEKSCLAGCCAPGASSGLQSSTNETSGMAEACCGMSSSDQSACSCCIADMVRRATLTHRGETGSIEVALNSLERYAENLRYCCAILEKCCRRACCFLNESPLILDRTSGPLRGCEVVSTEDLKADLVAAGNSQAPKAGSTLLHLEIGGMDCPDCISKVARVLMRLPSVTTVETDYFAGMAQLRYDPEVISSTAIVAQLARATGFKVRDMPRKDTETSSHITLPVVFRGRPPAVLMDKYDISHGSSGDIWDVSFHVIGEKALLPREVLAELEEHGGQLAPKSIEQAHDPATRDLWNLIIRTTLCIACTVPVLVLTWARLSPSPVLYGGISLGLATIVQVLAAPMYGASARSVLFIHQVDLNVLAAVSTFVSYVFSVVAYAFQAAHMPFSAPFFETCTLLITLIYLGRTVQGATRKSAGSAIHALHQLQTKDVRVVESETSCTVDSRLLHYGDCIEILPNTRIVTDGVVLSGSSDVDESSVTGESAAVSKVRGSRVIAGTINLDGVLRVEVTRLLHENSLARITQLVRHAQSSRAPLQDLADRLSAVILPLAVAVAGLAFMAWVIVNVFVRKRTKVDAVVDGLMHAIAVLVVSCPCAIGLAVPMVTSVSMRVLARSGILVRSADILHVMQHVSVVVFDKTGTLSQGLFTVVQSEVLVEGAERLVYELVKGNNHPIAQGVHRFLTEAVPPDHWKEIFRLSDISTLPGKGMRATLGGYEILGGKASFTGAASHPAVAHCLRSGHSLFTVTLGGTCIAVYGLADLPRPEAPRLVDSLKRSGKTVFINSGDNAAAVARFAAQIGVSEENLLAGCMPEDKRAFIQSLQRDKHERVLFVGDGTNDAPALATADAALAVVSSSDVARTSAGAVLLFPDIERGVNVLFGIASAADRRARISLGWCVMYMIIAIVLASGVAVKVSIEPRWAGLGELVSVLPVVLVGLSIGWSVKNTRFS